MKYLIFVLFLFPVLLSSQTIKIEGIDPNYKPSKTKKIILDTCKAEIIYKRTIVLSRDSSNMVYGKQHRMTLQIGERTSKFIDETHLLADSLSDASIDQGISVEATIGKLQSLVAYDNKDSHYINYPTGKITTRTSMLGPYIYEEDMPTIKWTLHPEKDKKLGYSCKKATCKLFGREYEVWYTNGIPISSGPWKLNGLPGLIVYVVDSKKEVYFECVSVKYPKHPIPIYITEESRNTIRMSKKQFLKLEKDYLKNPGSFLGLSGATPVGNLPTQATQERKKFFIELEE